MDDAIKSAVTAYGYAAWEEGFRSTPGSMGSGPEEDRLRIKKEEKKSELLAIIQALGKKARSGNSDAPGLYLDSGELVPAAELSAAKLTTKAPPSAITASIMRDDGGDHPAFCLMVAYRSQADAEAALELLSAAPTAQPAPQQEPHWWRKRADEIEMQVAMTGSPEAMRCYTDTLALLQAAAEPSPAPQADSVTTECGNCFEGKSDFDHVCKKCRGSGKAADRVLEDVALLDWLNENIFYREIGEWDAKYGHGDGYNMWVLFAPKGVQGSARTIISAARAAQEKKA